MKKTLTLLFAGISFFGFAQSFSLYKTNAGGAVTATLTNGYVISETSTVSAQTTTKIKIKNNAASTQTFNVIRSIVSMNPVLDLSNTPVNPTTYFCFGFSCFTSDVSTAGPGDYTILAASGQTSTSFPTSDNSADNGQPFSIYLEEGGSTGAYAVKYRVFTVGNTNDTTSFVVSYNNAVGIADHQVADFSFDIYPNPGKGESTIYVNSLGSSEVKVSVSAISGQLLSTENVLLNPGFNAIPLGQKDLASGIYLISVQNEKGMLTKKLVLTK
jgi:hypothetical protein